MHAAGQRDLVMQGWETGACWQAYGACSSQVWGAVCALLCPLSQLPIFPTSPTTRCHIILSATCCCWLQVVQKVEYPIWVVYVTQALMFGGGLAGISYGILSTSWDPRREGSALGWTELQVNNRGQSSSAGAGSVPVSLSVC